MSVVERCVGGRGVGGHTRKVTTFATTGGPQIKGWVEAFHKALKSQTKAESTLEHGILGVQGRAASAVGRPAGGHDKARGMKEKHINIRVEQCLALAKASACTRRTFGALLLDPERNVVLMDGYNGGPRGGGQLCGGDRCLRDELNIPSGTRMEIGCHHAEMNVICNAAANGVTTRGAWLIVTGEPCVLCAKLVHHAGITRVLVVGGGYLGENGVEYLKAHGVGVQIVEGPPDPRRAKQS